ncbi:glycoside hydrolase family 97 catalytic domain-containing protein [Janthinobacterium sp. PSPC1-1]|uniref:glycoside hydrolase family 97 protein n=1 Tax=Janthinobacterium sp. PSPC1-1 TaxID=2804581 RepID=UPI003CF8C7ED
MKPLVCSVALVFATFADAQGLQSPDGTLQVKVAPGPAGSIHYSISRGGAPVILPSTLGLEFGGLNLSKKLSLGAASPITSVAERYTMATGKRQVIDYAANEQTFTVHNARGQAMDVVFRVSNDGVAFRYVLGQVPSSAGTMLQESTSFAFAPSTRAWLQPMQVAQTGWMNTNPAYEEHYRMDIAVGTPSPLAAGWVFPALFKAGETWVALTEAGMDGSFHASRLQAASKGGIYRIGTPMAAEVAPGGALLAQAATGLRSPWRVLAIGSLATIMDSTLGTDLAAPAIAFDTAKVLPGHAAWSWGLLKDDATVYGVQKDFIDYAADMRWNYVLVDADWDRKIGYEKIAELASYAAAKDVGLFLWYNSSGSWNKTEYTPKGKLLTHAQREHEFSRLAAMGIKGIKVDFFAGDGQSMIAYYLGILNDAARHGLLVNFHGATLPRGWARTYPNLMTAEAVKGLEFTTFEQRDQDAMPAHAAMLPFARNLFDPMDFTPMVFGDVPNIRRATRNGFELALPVLFLSGVQNFAEIPAGMASVPPYVKTFLQELPRSWDDSRFIDGVPGRYLMLARQSGERWYVAGINAQVTAQTFTVDLSFLEGKRGALITDGAGERAFSQQEISAGKAVITIKPHGGFVAIFN